MITITKEIFEKHVISATNATADVFDSIEVYITSAQNILITSLIGQDAFNKINMQPNNITTEFERFICLHAYKSAIPSLDLVLTNTGFGIVSNQNVSPASYDRVQRLIKSVENSLDDCIDNIYSLLRGNDIWCNSNIAKDVFCSLFWNTDILRKLGHPTAHRSVLNEKAINISIAEERIKQGISIEFFYELCDSLRLKTSNHYQDIVISYIQHAVCCLIEGDQCGYAIKVKALLRYLDDNIDEFPIYRGSSAYEANHFTSYQNEKEDSCFFWG